MSTILPEDLGKSLDYAYDGMTGATAWLGYGIAGLYFIAQEYEHGWLLCDSIGYMNIITEALNKVM